jgi:hypothetical protein
MKFACALLTLSIASFASAVLLERAPAKSELPIGAASDRPAEVTDIFASLPLRSPLLQERRAGSMERASFRLKPSFEFALAHSDRGWIADRGRRGGFVRQASHQTLQSNRIRLQI